MLIWATPSSHPFEKLIAESFLSSYLDDLALAKNELEWLASVSGGVELRAVGQSSSVMNLKYLISIVKIVLYLDSGSSFGNLAISFFHGINLNAHNIL